MTDTDHQQTPRRLSPETLRSRVDLCRQAIRDAYGTPDDEVGATLFVSHHLEELSEDYWIAEFGSAAPRPEAIIDRLVPSYRSDDSGYSVDFTLPGKVTSYVICVDARADAQLSVSMES